MSCITLLQVIQYVLFILFIQSYPVWHDSLFQHVRTCVCVCVGFDVISTVFFFFYITINYFIQILRSVPVTTNNSLFAKAGNLWNLKPQKLISRTEIRITNFRFGIRRSSDWALPLVLVPDRRHAVFLQESMVVILHNESVCRPSESERMSGFLLNLSERIAHLYKKV